MQKLCVQLAASPVIGRLLEMHCLLTWFQRAAMLTVMAELD